MSAAVATLLPGKPIHPRRGRRWCGVWVVLSVCISAVSYPLFYETRDTLAYSGKLGAHQRGLSRSNKTAAAFASVKQNALSACPVVNAHVWVRPDDSFAVSCRRTGSIPVVESALMALFSSAVLAALALAMCFAGKCAGQHSLRVASKFRCWIRVW
jgi:hypothetical protein